MAFTNPWVKLTELAGAAVLGSHVQFNERRGAHQKAKTKSQRFAAGAKLAGMALIAIVAVPLVAIGFGLAYFVSAPVAAFMSLRDYFKNKKKPVQQQTAQQQQQQAPQQQQPAQQPAAQASVEQLLQATYAEFASTNGFRSALLHRDLKARNVSYADVVRICLETPAIANGTQLGNFFIRLLSEYRDDTWDRRGPSKDIGHFEVTEAAWNELQTKYEQSDNQTPFTRGTNSEAHLRKILDSEKLLSLPAEGEPENITRYYVTTFTPGQAAKLRAKDTADGQKAVVTEPIALNPSFWQTRIR